MGEAQDRGAPEGGWGWLCVLGVAGASAVHASLLTGFGVIYIQLIRHFQTSATQAAWAGALCTTIPGATGPLVSCLCRWFGERLVAFAGGIVTCAGLVTTGIAPNMYVVYCTFGIVTGFGMSLGHQPGFMVLAGYFQKRRGCAMGLASFGAGVGIFCTPPLLKLLFDEFGFMGAFLLFGGYSLHMCISGALLRPPPKMKESPANGHTTSLVNLGVTSQKDHLQHKGCVQNDNGSIILYTSTPSLINDKTRKQSTFGQFNCSAGHWLGSVWQSCSGGVLAVCAISYSVGHLLSVATGFLPALMVERGVGLLEASLLFTISGMAATVGTPLAGPILDLPAIRKVRCYVFSCLLLILGTSQLLLPLTRDYASVAVLSSIRSVTAGVLISQRATALGDMTSPCNMSSAWGLVMMANAAGNLVARVSSGIFRDYLGSYEICFYLSGATALLGCFIFTVINLFMKGHKQPKLPNYE